jgi:hypothetical protein
MRAMGTLKSIQVLRNRCNHAELNVRTTHDRLANERMLKRLLNMKTMQTMTVMIFEMKTNKES